MAGKRHIWILNGARPTYLLGRGFRRRLPGAYVKLPLPVPREVLIKCSGASVHPCVPCG